MFGHEIQLTSVMLGIGNINHAQVHRNNRLNFTVEMGNQVAAERYNGGITGSTINALSIQAGGMGAEHQGFVNIEGGWEQRRGLCMLKMNITENSLVQQEMAVLGYLVGGQDSYLGQIPDDVLFVPVRSWTVSKSAGQNAKYMPQENTLITESSQFLMNDPALMTNLRSVRPVDIINHGFGEQNAIEENREGTFAGSTGSELGDRGLIVSRSNNLDPMAASSTLMNHAARVSRTNMQYNTLSENMASSMGNLSEMEIFQHPFLGLMMSALGMQDYNGFIGFSFGELRQVFNGFDRCILSNSSRGDIGEVVDHRLTTHSLGSVDYFEKLANELAFISLHAMIDVGLVYMEFVASNTVSRMNVNNGDIFFQGGTPAGVIDNDSRLEARKESFKDYIVKTFFTKYSAKGMGNAMLVSVKVKMNIFGESSVSIILNGNESEERTKVFTSYTINRTSSDIATTDNQVNAASQYLENLQNYFVRN